MADTLQIGDGRATASTSCGMKAKTKRTLKAVHFYSVLYREEITANGRDGLKYYITVHQEAPGTRWEGEKMGGRVGF